MIITIPSYNRAGRVKTLDWIPEIWKDHTYLVVRRSQLEEYTEEYGFDVHVVAADDENGIVGARRSCGILAEELMQDNFLMLDDDLSFHRVIGARCTKLDEVGMEEMIECLQTLSEEYRHVHLSPRFMCNDKTTITEICKQTQATVYDTEVFNSIEWPSISSFEDIYRTVYLLAHGYKNCKLNTFCVSPGPTRRNGGLAGLVNYNKASQDAQIIANTFETVTPKTTNADWYKGEGYTTRPALSVSWKKSFKMWEL